MPVRDSGGQRPPARTGATAPARQSSKPNTDDVWDDIMNRKSGGSDDGTFNKMNTNFFLQDGEKIDIVLLDNDPILFGGHSIKCKSDAGKTFYRIEQCQKSEQEYCVLCESDNSAVSKAKSIIAFRVLDSRGSWVKDKGLDGIPAPKIFLTPLYLAKQIKTLLDDAEGELRDKVLQLSKSGNYAINFKLKKHPQGGMDYVTAPEYDGDMPEVLDVYATMSDDDLIDFVRKFADGGGNASKQRGNNNSGRNGSTVGSFGD